MNLHISWAAQHPVDFPLMQMHFWESFIEHKAAFYANSADNASCDLHSNALKCTKSVSSGHLRNLLNILVVLRKASREGQPKRIMEGVEGGV